MSMCANHSERKAHRKGLCKTCYERQLRENNPEYAQRYREAKARQRARSKSADPEGFAQRVKDASAKYRKNNPDKVKTPWEVNPVKAREAVDRYREKNAEKVRQKSREWATQNKEKQQAYVEVNKEKVLAYLASWKAANPHKLVAYRAARRAAELNATPPWVDRREIERFYQEAKLTGMEVDHVIPLRGKTVSGLHVPENLQLLDRHSNRKKGNSYAG